MKSEWRLKNFLIEKIQEYKNLIEQEIKPDRVFYVDAAKSITQNGQKYWKCSVVENGKLVKDFIDEENTGREAPPAEAFAIFKAVEYLVEQKWTGKVLIYSDSADCCNAIRNERIFSLFLRFGEENSDVAHKMRKKKYRCLLTARKLALENNIDLKIEWMIGKYNHADWFSRKNKMS